MKVKTSEILITVAQRDQITSNWEAYKGSTFNPEILDNETKSQPTELKLNLRVPYQVKGTTNHMLVKSIIAFHDNDDKMKMSLNSEINKPLIIAAVLGIISAMLFLVLYSNFIYFILLAATIGGIYYAYFYSRLLKTSKECLEEIKQNYP